MAKAQILIVEDDHDLREALVTTLELAKFRVREAANAEQALICLAEGSSATPDTAFELRAAARDQTGPAC